MIVTPTLRRNYLLSLAVMAGVLTVGGIFFHNSEVGSYVVPGTAFFSCLILFNLLNDRERRREQRSGEPPSS
jgi:ABC-type multidrug transport system permease subunit